RSPSFWLEAFLGSVESAALWVLPPSHSHLSVNGFTDLPMKPAYMLGPGQPLPGPPILLRPPIARNELRWYRNVDLFPIGYAFRPRLRGRLTLGGRTFPRKP